MALTSKVLEEKARHTKSNVYGKVCKSQFGHGKHISSLKQSHLLGVYPILFIGSFSSTTSSCSTAVLFLQIAQLRLNFLIKNLSSFEATALLAQRSDFT